MDDYRFQGVRDGLLQTGLQAVLDLPGITEVAVNQPSQIWFERGQGWEVQAAPGCRFDACLRLAEALAVLSDAQNPLGFNHPIASVILPDGERGQVVVAPATEAQCVSLTFRKPSLQRFSMANYESSGRLRGARRASRQLASLSDDQKAMLMHLRDDDLGPFFKLAVEQRLNILLVGGTGSGKTTFMKAIADLYPAERRIFTIEDVHELSLPKHPNHLHLFYQRDGIQPKTLIEACMRMKPDHVFLAELRGNEAWSYIEMLNTGHAGSITTVHANDCTSAFARLAALVKQSPVGQTLDYDFILNTVKTSIDVVCFFQGSYLKEIYFDPEEKIRLLNH